MVGLSQSRHLPECRSSHEERGLKFECWFEEVAPSGSRSSHEERGLKYVPGFQLLPDLRVAPRMRSVD